MRSGLGRYLAHPPERMVEEEEIIRLHTKARAILSGPDYTEVAQLAGRLTGDYVVANRIPRAVCVVLRCLLGVLASRLLMRSIARHAWTFVGSGMFTYRKVPGTPEKICSHGKSCHTAPDRMPPQTASHAAPQAEPMVVLDA